MSNNHVLKILEIIEKGEEYCEHEWVQEVNGEMYVENDRLMFKVKRKCSKCGRYELVLKDRFRRR